MWLCQLFTCKIFVVATTPWTKAPLFSYIWKFHHSPFHWLSKGQLYERLVVNHSQLLTHHLFWLGNSSGPALLPISFQGQTGQYFIHVDFIFLAFQRFQERTIFSWRIVCDVWRWRYPRVPRQGFDVIFQLQDRLENFCRGCIWSIARYQAVTNCVVIDEHNKLRSRDFLRPHFIGNHPDSALLKRFNNFNDFLVLYWNCVFIGLYQ